MANDHYVSRSYLKRFLHPKTLSEGVPQLYPYSRADGAMRARGVKVLGCAEDFYRVRSRTGKSDRTADEFLTSMENEVFRDQPGRQSAYADLTAAAKWPLSVSQKHELAFVIAMMRCRAPIQIHNAAMLLELAENLDAFNKLNNQSFKQMMISDGATEDEVTMGTAAFVRGDVRMAVAKHEEKHVGLESLAYIPKLAEILRCMRWRLITAPKEELLITSDNPAVIHVPEQRDGQGIIQSAGTELWFPISYDHGLLLDHRTGGDIREIAGHSQLRALNRRIVKWCYRFVYSPRPLEWLDRAVRESAFRPLLGRLTSLQSLFDTAANDILDLSGYLRTSSATSADIFEGNQMR